MTKVFSIWTANKPASLKAGKKIFTCWAITIKTQSMDKEEIRSIMGELIRLQAIIKEMEKSGFQWEKVQEISDSLRLLIIDLENSLD